MNLSTWLLVGLGGALGAVFRFGVGTSVQLNTTFPVATLVVNLLGCFIIGMLFQVTQYKVVPWIAPFLMVGFLGGFTTFSSFGLEAIKMYQNQQFTFLVVYILVSNIVGILSVFAGINLCKFVMSNTSSI